MPSDHQPLRRGPRRFTPLPRLLGANRFVMSPADMPPDGATPPVLGVCDGCPAAAVVVFWRVLLLIPPGWWIAQPWVRELHLCAHHARGAEPQLRGWAAQDAGAGDVEAWVPVVDIRRAGYTPTPL